MRKNIQAVPLHKKIVHYIHPKLVLPRTGISILGVFGVKRSSLSYLFLFEIPFG
jgi:hypothetical protein